MHLLSLTTIYPNETNAAEGRSVAFLDQALSKLGVKGTTLVLKPWIPRWLGRRVNRWNHLAVRRRTVRQDGLQIVFAHYLHIPYKLREKACVHSMARQAIRLIRKQGLTFDVVHGQSIYPAALAALMVARHFKVPYVVTLRDDLSHLMHWYEHHRGRELFNPMFASVSAIFVHGPSLLRDIPSFIPPGAHPDIFMAPNGVDIGGILAILNSLPTSTDHPWTHIVSVGHLYRLKGIHENLHALRLLNERGFRRWKYTVVGGGPYRKELEDLSKGLGLQDQVTFVGRVPYRESIHYIRDADIFSLPSWGESFGNVYAEAAVCGRPAIGCRGYGAELMIKHGETGLLVPPQDPKALADALTYLLTDPARAKGMGRSAREHIKRFTWEGTAQLYEKTFRGIVGR